MLETFCKNNKSFQHIQMFSLPLRSLFSLFVPLCEIQRTSQGKNPNYHNKGGPHINGCIFA